MRNLIWATGICCLLALSSCATLQDFFNVLSGNNAQKITRTPIWVYKPDLRINVDGGTFAGVAASVIPKTQTTLTIWSAVSIDRVEISTCSRHDVCQIKGGELACDQLTSDNPYGRFLIETGFFGSPGKSMQYYFTPDKKEREDSCSNMFIAIYDEDTLAAWGFVGFRSTPDQNFPAKFTCNATDWNFAGLSVCAAKAGTIQEINFTAPVDDFRADTLCNLKQVSGTEFEFQVGQGWCRASFMQGTKFHDVIINGYDEVLLRGNASD